MDGSDRSSLQEDLRRILEWCGMWEMTFNVNKCHILQVGTRKQKYHYEMNGVKIESIKCVENFGVTIVSNQKFSHQSKDAVAGANRMFVLYIEISPSKIKP